MQHNTDRAYLVRQPMFTNLFLFWAIFSFFSFLFYFIEWRRSDQCTARVWVHQQHTSNDWCRNQSTMTQRQINDCSISLGNCQIWRTYYGWEGGYFGLQDTNGVSLPEHALSQCCTVARKKTRLAFFATFHCTTLRYTALSQRDASIYANGRNITEAGNISLFCDFV